MNKIHIKCPKCDKKGLYDKANKRFACLTVNCWYSESVDDKIKKRLRNE